MSQATPRKRHTSPELSGLSPDDAHRNGNKPPLILLLVGTLFFLSGGTGLVYEIVWTRELIFVFGGTTHAITTVLVAFMAGLGLGSYLAGRICHRLREPGRLYGAIEIIIGVYAVCVPLLLTLAQPLYAALYTQTQDSPSLLLGARFLVSCIVLLTPTTLMGATLPLLVQYVGDLTGVARGDAAQTGARIGRQVGFLYGLNTTGAVMGTLMAGFVLLPALGLRRTTWLAAGINVALGVAAVVALRAARRETTHLGETRPDGNTMPDAASHPAASRLPASAAKRDDAAGAAPAVFAVDPSEVLAVFALSGFTAMVYQIAWTRALVMSIGSSTYAFTCILGAFILGLALGSLACAALGTRIRRPVRAIGLLQCGIGISAVLIAPLYERIPTAVRGLIQAYSEDFARLLALEFGLVMAITIVPTLLMGAMFPLVVRAIRTSDDSAASATGRAYGINTIGTILGSFTAGFFLIRSDVLGLQNSIIAAAVLNAATGAWLIARATRPAALPMHRMLAAGAAAIAVAICGRAMGTWNKVVLTSGPFLRHSSPMDERTAPEVIFYADGVDLTVSVLRWRWDDTQLTLTVNGKPDASTTITDMSTQMLIAHLPGLLHPQPRTACVIGLGSGMTVSSLALYPSLERIDCVELSQEVIDAASYFADYTGDVLNTDPRVRMVRADGRNHLLLSPERYDLILSEPSNPWIAGIANLFTRDFFEMCRRRLNDNGMLAVWVNGSNMVREDFQIIVRTLCEVFPHVSAWEMCWYTDYLFIATNEPQRIPLSRVRQRFDLPGVREDLFRVGLDSLDRVMARYLASAPALRAWAAEAPIHTDDNALLEFSAPRALYRPEAVPIGLALASLPAAYDEWLELDELVPRNEAARLARRLPLMAEARRHRMAGLAAVPAGDSIGALRHYLAAWEKDPGDILMYSKLNEAAETILRSPPIPPEYSDIAVIPEMVKRIPVGMAVRPQGAARGHIVETLAHHAREAVSREQWEIAAYNLLRVRELDPEHQSLQLLDAHEAIRKAIERFVDLAPAG